MLTLLASAAIALAGIVGCLIHARRRVIPRVRCHPNRMARMFARPEEN